MSDKLLRIKQQTVEIKSLANGRWPTILASLIPSIRDACDNFNPNKRTGCACPFHAAKSNTSFKLLKQGAEVGSAGCFTCGTWSDGFELIMFDRGCSFYDAVQLVGEQLGYYGINGEVDQKNREIANEAQKRWELKKQQQKEKDEVKRVNMLKKLGEIWSECFDLERPESLPARLYFANRGLGSVGNLNGEVVFHPALDYYYKDSNGKYVFHGKFPAIISQIRNPEGVPVRIHRTYITNDGYKLLAPDHSPKKMSPEIPFTPITGGSIQLSPAGTKVIGVGEGLETTLAARVATGMPVNCCINAQLLSSWLPAAGTEHVFIFLDKDVSGTGYKVALQLKDRLEQFKLKVYLCFPPLPIKAGEKSVDWANVYNEVGVSGFPVEAINWRNLL